MTHEKAMTILFLSTLASSTDQYFGRERYEKRTGIQVTNSELKDLLSYAVEFIKGVDFIKEVEPDLFYVGY